MRIWNKKLLLEEKGEFHENYRIKKERKWMISGEQKFKKKEAIRKMRMTINRKGRYLEQH